MLQGCASHNQIDVPAAPQVYLDSHFGPAPQLETEQKIFHLSDSMKRYVQLRLRPKKTVEQKTHRLLKDFFDPNQLDIQYEHNANLTAEEAFEQGVANCLSLTILSYVLAQEANLEATFMDVEVVENWTYNKGVRMLNGHVNLKIMAPPSPNVVLKYETAFVIDFLPMLELKAKKATPLKKQDIIALFYSNKGANALVNGDENLAYHYFKQGTLLAPHLAEIWGNLASLYMRNGHLKEVETILMYASAIDPDNLNVRESLAHLYLKTDRQSLAGEMFSEIRKIRNKNPYYFAMLGKSAFNDGLFEDSIKHYKKAIKLNSREHQFLFGLAQNYLSLNDLQKANVYLKRARALANDANDVRRYDSKIYALQNIARL